MRIALTVLIVAAFLVVMVAGVVGCGPPKAPKQKLDNVRSDMPGNAPGPDATQEELQAFGKSKSAQMGGAGPQGTSPDDPAAR